MKKLNYRICCFQLMILVVLVLFCMTPAWSGWEQYGTDIKINTDGTSYYQEIAVASPSIAVFQSAVYTVWVDNRNNVEGQADIYFAKGAVDAEGNVTFGQNVRVNDQANSAGTDWSARPSIAVNQDGYIYVVWGDNRNSDDQQTSNDIYLAISKDGGASFEANKQVDLFPQDETQHTDCRAPKVAVAESYVYIIFGSAARMEIAVSSDKGEHFSFAQSIDGGLIDNAVIAASGNNVYLAQASSADVLTDYDEIFFARSTDNGESFSDFELVNDDGGGERQGDVSIAASGEHVYLLWRDSRETWSLYMAESHDQGRTFGANISVTSDTGTPNPSISAYKEHVAISYTDTRRTIIARVSHNAGGTWSEEQTVSDSNSPIAIGPSSIAINDQIVGVMWEERTDDHSDVFGDGFRFADGSTEPIPVECPADGVTLTVEGAEKFIMTFPDICYDGQTSPFNYKLILNADGTWGLAPL